LTPLQYLLDHWRRRLPVDEARSIVQDMIDDARGDLGEAVSDNDYAEAARQEVRIKTLEDVWDRLS
jgi:hypothetical protein